MLSYLTTLVKDAAATFWQGDGIREQSPLFGEESIFVLGMVALIWAPETKGKPLPED